MDNTDYAFEMASSSVRFGNGVTREVGEDVKEMGLKKVVLFTDKNLVNMRPVQVTEEALKKSGIKYVIYDNVRIEPSDKSFKDAIKFVQADNYDGFIAVGGGSVMDTAKAANLYSCYPVEDFLAYVNPPIGKGLPPPGILKPLICIPTTAGTGSETTGVAIFDFEETKSKTGIAHRRLKPTLGIVDPENTYTLPPYVTAASGFDVLSHSLESYTALHFNKRSPRPERPILRPAYQGSNPISDVWSLKSLELCSKWLPIAVEDPNNKEARFQMMLAATYAGIGFGNAGVHLCHGLSYPVASQVKTYQAKDYPTYKPLIPHGMSVIINAPSVFSFTGISNPERHRTVAKIMGADVDTAKDEVVGDRLAEQIIKMMSRFKFPGSLRDLGFGESDIDGLVEATLPQKRVTVLSPRKAEAPELKSILVNSLKGYY